MSGTDTSPTTSEYIYFHSYIALRARLRCAVLCFVYWHGSRGRFKYGIPVNMGVAKRKVTEVVVGEEREVGEETEDKGRK